MNLVLIFHSNWKTEVSGFQFLGHNSIRILDQRIAEADTRNNNEVELLSNSGQSSSRRIICFLVLCVHTHISEISHPVYRRDTKSEPGITEY